MYEMRCGDEGFSVVGELIAFRRDVGLAGDDDGAPHASWQAGR